MPCKIKNLADYHVHSDISPDSSETMENAARAARSRGLTEIAFTDHYDAAYPGEESFGTPDLGHYFENLARVREAFPDLVIRSGIELGMVREANDEIRRTLEPWSFDFVMYSKHVVRGKDPWYEDYFAGRTLREGERDYLEDMLADLRSWDDFDIVGHIGYVDKNLLGYSRPLPDAKPFEYADFPDELDALLREIVSRGKGIEVNTSAYADWRDGMPRRSVLRRYAELGGEIVTLGSDAHQAEKVGRFFPEALSLLQDCGLRWVCTFNERKPQFHAIEGGDFA